MCMLAAPRPMSPARIIEALWEDEPPAGALNTVQAYVSKLRRILEPGRVRAVAPSILVSKLGGYALVVPDESLDLARARAHAAKGARLLGRGELAGARDELRRALAEWRGDPLSGFEEDSWARAEISHLGELRLTLVEDTAEAELGLGIGAGMVLELTRLLAGFPCASACAACAPTRSTRQDGRPTPWPRSPREGGCWSRSWASTPTLAPARWRGRYSPRIPR